jgi:hypothetical protein
VAPPARHVRGAIRVTRRRRRDRRKVSEPNSTKRVGIISGQGWKREFDDPIPLPRGCQLVTLEDAGRYIQKLPKAEQQIDEWQTAIEVLLLVAEHGGPAMMARIGVMRALNRHVERVFDPSRKDHHWARRKLAIGDELFAVNLEKPWQHLELVISFYCRFVTLTSDTERGDLQNVCSQAESVVAYHLHACCGDGHACKRVS